MDKVNASVVLVFDDDTEYGELVSLVLQNNCGVDQVVCSSSAPDALAYLQDAPVHGQPGLLLIDLHMPQMNGLATLAEVRSRAPDVPCVLMSNAASPSEREECIRNGAVAFLQKPQRAEDLITALRSTLELARKS